MLTIYCICVVSEFCLVSLLLSYDSEGRLTNVTYPTGVVTSLHREMEETINIDMESSNRDDDVTVITNLSSVEASYTVVQGTQHRRNISQSRSHADAPRFPSKSHPLRPKHTAGR